MLQKKSISVFIPSYNESENIEEAVGRIYTYISKAFSDFEIIVIDSSTDDTYKKLLALKKRGKVTKIVHQLKNLGYGTALRTGFSQAKKDLIFYTDADNQFDIQDLKFVYPLIQTCDIVSAYRIKRADPFMRIITADVYNWFIRLLFHLNVRDVDSSFKLYKREVFDNIIIKAKTGFIDAEILIKARKKGYTIKQIGVNHYPRIKGKTSYELGNRNAFIAFVKPVVIIDILKEIKQMWPELK